MPRFLLAAVAAVVASPLAAAPKVTLAENGKATLPVVIAKDSPPRVKQAAADLAAYLGKITGGTFAVETGDGRTGIAVGVAAQFPAAPHGGGPAEVPLAAREDYRLATHPQGVVLLGQTEHAVEHAVWDFLHRVGYRQFFPGEKWEVIPKSPTLAIELDATEA